ncbi:sensor histidine kinase [Caminibacter sp.]
MFLVLTNIIFSKSLFSEKEKNLKLEEKIVLIESAEIAKSFLKELLKEYNNKKEEIINAHKYVLNHLTENIWNLKKHLGKNYHIFITDKNFTIVKTTFKYDQNFSLAFAKDIFLKHKNKIGISPPICEMATTNFFSYTDSYQNGYVLQVGYIFNSPKLKKFKEKLKEIKEKYPFIKDINLYFVYPQINYASKCNILTPLFRKYSLKEMEENRIKGLKYYNLIKDSLYIGESRLLKKVINPFDNTSSIIYEMVIDKNYIAKITKKNRILSLSMLFITIIVIIITLFYFGRFILNINELTEKIKAKKEIKNINCEELKPVAKSYNETLKELKELINSKEDFLRFILHELKTPLSILSLYAENKASIAAIKQLNNAYEEMSYFKKLSSPLKKERFNLKDLVLERVEYFKELIELNEKNIHLNLNDLYIFSTKENIKRLIDSNLSNAIKYAKKDISITIKDNSLIFSNEGNIKDTKKIFEKFYREENVKGGFGLGLFIVNEIARKENIKIEVKNENNKIFFIYTFKERDENSNN